MSLFSFLKDAGEKLFGRPVAQASAAPAQASSGQAASASTGQSQDAANGEAIKNYIESLGLKVAGLKVTYDSATFTATVSGAAADQETKEKAVLSAGNVMNVAKVDDQMTVTGGGAEAQFYTVAKGDTLSKVAKQFYGDANQYNKIFEANKPMLKSPDLIYPGQVLRVPK